MMLLDTAGALPLLAGSPDRGGHMPPGAGRPGSSAPAPFRSRRGPHAHTSVPGTYRRHWPWQCSRAAYAHLSSRAPPTCIDGIIWL